MSKQSKIRGWIIIQGTRTCVEEGIRLRWLLSATTIKLENIIQSYSLPVILKTIGLANGGKTLVTRAETRVK